MTNKTLTISDLTPAERATLETLKTAAAMTENQALAAIAVQREAVAKAVADATAKKQTVKKLPEFSAPVYALLKTCFKAEYKAAKTELEQKITELEKQITDTQGYIDALSATNDKLRERAKGEKLTDKQREKLVGEMNKNTEEIKNYQTNIETAKAELETAKTDLATAKDEWVVNLPEFGDKPTYDDVLAYFQHKEGTQRANSGRADNGKASKGQTLPKYNLSVAADITVKVCQFLGVDIPADVPAADNKADKAGA